MRTFCELGFDPVDWLINILVAWKLNFHSLKEGQEPVVARSILQELLVTHAILESTFKPHLPGDVVSH